MSIPNFVPLSVILPAQVRLALRAEESLAEMADSWIFTVDTLSKLAPAERYRNHHIVRSFETFLYWIYKW